jgi:arylsulfatase A
MAAHTDILPTLCDLLDLPLPADRKLDGRSILPLLQNGKGDSPHQYVHHTWDRYVPNPHNRWSISDKRYKLVGHKPKGKPQPPEPAGRLYDLRDDPGETRDISRQHPEIVKRLRTEFLRWFDDVTAGQTYQPVPIPVGHPQQQSVELQASWAKLDGETIQYTFRGYDWDTVDGWNKPGESATWRLDVVSAGRYDVTVSYGCSHADSGGKLRLSVGDASLECRPQATVTADAFAREPLGTINLKKGPATLKAEAATIPGRELMRLNRVWLTKSRE